MPVAQWLSLAIASLTLLGVAFGRWPLVRVNRASIALVGAALLVATGVLDIGRAWSLLDGNTLVLLFSMMIVSAFLAVGGFFRSAVRWAAGRAGHPLGLLAGLVLTSGLLSALFLNDTVVLMLTPLVLGLCRALERNPVPYLIALAASANVGSVATITGNPQNLIIGTQSGISYLDFVLALGPVALTGLLVVVGVVVWRYPGEFLSGRLARASLPTVDADRRLLVKSAGVSALLVAAFALGLPAAASALVAAALLLVTRRVGSDRVFELIHWDLLVLFAGLFVVTGSLELTGLGSRLVGLVAALAGAGPAVFAGMVAAASSILSNVPTVLLLAPAMPELAEPQRAWLMLAMASTLAGNLTLVGSVANLIVAEGALREGVVLGFWSYLAAGVPITVLTLLWGVAWLSFGIGQ
ncbi:MAG TPA: anion transporter [Trueperaceae bacterium]